jgi:hypothetical protein
MNAVICEALCQWPCLKIHCAVAVLGLGLGRGDGLCIANHAHKIAYRCAYCSANFLISSRALDDTSVSADGGQNCDLQPGDPVLCPEKQVSQPACLVFLSTPHLEMPLQPRLPCEAALPVAVRLAAPAGCIGCLGW